MTARVMNDYLVDTLHLGIGLQGFNYFTQDRLANLVAALQSFRPGKITDIIYIVLFTLYHE